GNSAKKENLPSRRIYPKLRTQWWARTPLSSYYSK
ncbi:MAG: hypothetical protein ACI97P_001584, partial [Arcticibacterium sp.]